VSRLAAKKPNGGESRAFRPIAPSRGLTHELVERLTAEIIGGKLAPGAKLPTEQEMIAATGVSRTVVREALAALRAEGLVVIRQGVGAFVAESVRRPFRIDVDQLRSLHEVVEVMELRVGIEVEAASLAAERASAADKRRIEQAYTAIDQAIGRGELGVDEDFALHRSIAVAAANPQFERFLQYLGRFIIPRQTVRVNAALAVDRAAYLRKLQREHREIVDAIGAGAVTKARAAMRQHLMNSRNRYRKLAADLGEE
jgi:GntR family transcriptional regulator, transcriptional repressor for pyruvate dehydrogenase complex